MKPFIDNDLSEAVANLAHELYKHDDRGGGYGYKDGKIFGYCSNFGCSCDIIHKFLEEIGAGDD